MNIYVLTEGEYSDYRIKGLFSTKEKAQKMAVEYNVDPERIEVWSVDDTSPRSDGMLAYSVRIYPNGNIEEVRRESIEWHPRNRDWEPYGDGQTLSMSMLARDEAHAEKIAGERLFKAMASPGFTLDFGQWHREFFKEKK